jgi:hypothetical protein
MSDDMIDPVGVAQRNVARIVEAILRHRAAKLAHLAGPHRDVRRGVGTSDSKRAGRQRVAAILVQHADTLSGWIGDDRRCTGAPVDAAVVGYLAAWASGMGPAKRQMVAEMADCGTPIDLSGLIGDDYAGILGVIFAASK